MAKLQIAQLGEPILRQKAKKVSKAQFSSTKFKQFVVDLIETLKEDKRGAGLAATQVHIPMRVYVIKLLIDIVPNIIESSREFKSGQFEVLINPKLTIIDKKMNYWLEGCLSFYDLVGYVPRSNIVRVDYKDKSGKWQYIIAKEWLSILLQHEYDHLDGILWLDRVKSMSDVFYKDVYDELVKKGIIT